MLLDKRVTFEPFEYQEAYNFWERQQQSHWLHTEVSLKKDINDWKTKLTDSEKQVIGQTLKGFVQAEVIIGDFWSRRVAKWFPKPEIAMMALGNASFETIHTKAYSQLNSALGETNYKAFLQDPTTKAKMDNFIDVKGSKPEDIVRALAIFSAFGEGVQIFSAFAILMSFSLRNLMTGTGQIVEWSVRDETLHSMSGCWLFNQMIKEYPELQTKELKEDVYEAARTCIRLEDDFIDAAFSLGDIPNISAYDLKQYLRHRVNVKLGDIGYGSLYRNLDKEALSRMSWFNNLTSGKVKTDFFHIRPTDYAKGNVDWDKTFEDEGMILDISEENQEGK